MDHHLTCVVMFMEYDHLDSSGAISEYSTWLLFFNSICTTWAIKVPEHLYQSALAFTIADQINCGWETHT